LQNKWNMILEDALEEGVYSCVLNA